MTPGLLLAASLAAQDAGFVYVEVNVGVAVGGHVALLLGEEVVHFQQSDDQLSLVRDSWPRFCRSYAGLQNRGLHVALLDLSPDDVGRIDRRCTLAWIEQELERERLSRLEADAAWLEALRAQRPLPPVRGAGWFVASRGAEPEGATLLRDAVVAAHGAELLDRALLENDAAIAAFRLEPGSTDLEPLREALRLRAALLAIRDERALAPGSLVDVLEPSAGLTSAEVVALEAIQALQRDAVVALLRSRRADRGLPLLVAVARHRALSRSLEEGRLRVLDLSAGAPRRSPRPEEIESFALEVRETSRRSRALREALLTSTYEEACWTELEQVATRHREAMHGVAGDPVCESDARIPARPGAVDPAPDLADLATPAELAEKAAAARATYDRARAAADERAAYSLLHRNCVTELVQLVRSSFPDEAAADAALGGALDADGLEALPRPFYEHLVASLPVRELHVLNHRRAELARLAAIEPGVWTTVRETTTLGSTTYEPRDCDGHFLLFTDDVVWRRPIRGVLNLGYGLGQGIAGLVTAPFDGGRRLQCGLHGALFSLPELVFVNVRKGTFADVVER